MNKTTNLNSTLDPKNKTNLRLSLLEKNTKEKRKLPKIKKKYKLSNELLDNAINNNINNNSNSLSPIFQSKNKNKELKNKHNNKISIDKSQNKIGGMKKINKLNINNVKQNFDLRKTSLNEFNNGYISTAFKQRNNIFIYTRHYGDNNKCPLCQSMDMKVKLLENKKGLKRLYKKNIKSETEDKNPEINTSNNNIRFLPILKGIEEQKDTEDFSIKRDLSTINLNINQDNYFQNAKEQFIFNIIRNRGPIKKLGINIFPVLDKYFNS